MMNKWFQIGVQLGINETSLHQIEADYRTMDRRFSEMISFWLNGNTQVPITWKSLIEVLESRFVNKKGLAKKIRKKGGLELTKSEEVDPLLPGTIVLFQYTVLHGPYGWKFLLGENFHLVLSSVKFIYHEFFCPVLMIIQSLW